jgi:hypothetical protein
VTPPPPITAPLPLLSDIHQEISRKTGATQTRLISTRRPENSLPNQGISPHPPP